MENGERKSLFVKPGTTLGDVVDFLLSRREPIEVGGCRIWDFNNHDPDYEALNEFARMHSGEFVIPFGMSYTWAIMLELLPRRFRRLPALHYRKGVYYFVRLEADEEEISRAREEVERAFTL